MTNQTSKTRIENLRTLEFVFKIFGAEIFEEFLNSKGYSVAPYNIPDVGYDIYSSEKLGIPETKPIISKFSDALDDFNNKLDKIERDGCEV